MVKRARVPLWQRLVAAGGLVATSPLGVASALLVLLNDGRPVLYKAPRVGCNNTRFVMFKFRTMRNGAAAGGAISGGVDPRVFVIGQLLRRTKLDELPQLLNVVRGEMAIVGPRPEDPSIVDEHYEPWMMATLDVPPGITSPGSLCYFADEGRLPNDPAAAYEAYLTQLLPRKLATDLVYVRHRSLTYDLELVLRTFAGILGLRAWSRRRSEREQAEGLALLRELQEKAAA